MSTRVTDLTVLQSISGDEMILVRQNNNNLATIATGKFRPATWYTGVGTGKPSNIFTTAAPNHPAVHGPFKEGDLYRQVDGADTSSWSWDTLELDWVLIPSANVSSILDRYSSSSDYDESTTLVVDTNNFKDGDFYRNLNNNRMYGPYVSGVGIDFDPDTAQVFFLGSKEEYSSIEDTSWNPWDTSNKIDEWYLPQDKSIYHQKLSDDFHGGYLWEFSRTAFDNESGSIEEKRIAAWGSRVNARTPKQFSVATKPSSFDDLKYISGDTALVIGTQSIWGPYVEEQVDIDSAWGLEPLMSRPARLFNLETLERDYIPTPDNSIYKTGDNLLWKQTKGTLDLTLLFLYDSTLDGNNGLWVEQQVLRAPAVFTITQGDGVFADHSNVDDLFYASSGMPVERDIIKRLYTYPTGHAYGVLGELSGYVEELTITNVDRESGAITTETRLIIPNPISIYQDINTIPIRDDSSYNDGDIIRNADGASFRYKKGQETDKLSWVIFDIGNTYKHIVELPDNSTNPSVVPSEYTPSLKHGDMIQCSIVGGTKVKLFEVLSNTLGDEYYCSTGYTLNEVIPTNVGEYLSSSYGVPSRDDTAYRTGDLITNASGVSFTYLEGQPTNELSWTFHNIVRSQILLVTSQIADYIPPTNSPNLAGIDDIELEIGDRLLVNVINSITGKQKIFMVTGRDRVNNTLTWSSGINTSPSRIFIQNISGQPIRNDDDYSDGDFVDNSDGIRYGPYAEGQESNISALPSYLNLQASSIMIDTVTGTGYELVMINGVLNAREV